MALFDSIQNYCELLVYEQIRRNLAEGSLANNPKLLEDIACIALNRLPPRYVREAVDTSFYMTSAEREQLDIGVYNAVNAAVEIVRERPDGPWSEVDA